MGCRKLQCVSLAQLIPSSGLWHHRCRRKLGCPLLNILIFQVGKQAWRDWVKIQAELGSSRVRSITKDTVWLKYMDKRCSDYLSHPLKLIIFPILKPWLRLCVPLRVLSHFYQYFSNKESRWDMCPFSLPLASHPTQLCPESKSMGTDSMIFWLITCFSNFLNSDLGTSLKVW